MTTVLVNRGCREAGPGLQGHGEGSGWKGQETKGAARPPAVLIPLSSFQQTRESRPCARSAWEEGSELGRE